MIIKPLNIIMFQKCCKIVKIVPFLLKIVDKFSKIVEIVSINIIIFLKFLYFCACLVTYFANLKLNQNSKFTIFGYSNNK
jgi:hypothetical protein